MDLVDVAENAFGLVEPSDGLRVVSDELILLAQPGGSPITNMALRLRFADDELDERIESVRAWFGEQGVEGFTWWVGSAATPGVHERLLLTRARPEPDEPEVAAMVLQEAPPLISGIDVRQVVTLDDWLLSRRIMSTVFGLDDPHTVDRGRAGRELADRVRVSFLAFVDGEPAGRAAAFITEAGPVQLGASGVLEAFRSRGVYRALVRARWEWASGLGVSVLVTQAGHMSQPILERVGFRTVGHLRILRDSTVAGRTG